MELDIKDVIAKAMLDKKFRAQLILNPTTAAESMNVRIDRDQAVILDAVASKMREMDSSKIVVIDKNVVAGHGSVTW